ncbi:Ras subfamily protein [Pelomyxa schiedti]|nr:Ras subfamily protein [Pelomyxa schiedti]
MSGSTTKTTKGTPTNKDKDPGSGAPGVPVVVATPPKNPAFAAALAAATAAHAQQHQLQHQARAQTPSGSTTPHPTSSATRSASPVKTTTTTVAVKGRALPVTSGTPPLHHVTTNATQSTSAADSPRLLPGLSGASPVLPPRELKSVHGDVISVVCHDKSNLWHATINFPGSMKMTEVAPLLAEHFQVLDDKKFNVRRVVPNTEDHVPLSKEEWSLTVKDLFGKGGALIPNVCTVNSANELFYFEKDKNGKWICLPGTGLEGSIQATPKSPKGSQPLPSATQSNTLQQTPSSNPPQVKSDWQRTGAKAPPYAPRKPGLLSNQKAPASAPSPSLEIAPPPTIPPPVPPPTPDTTESHTPPNRSPSPSSLVTSPSTTSPPEQSPPINSPPEQSPLTISPPEQSPSCSSPPEQSPSPPVLPPSNTPPLLPPDYPPPIPEATPPVTQDNLPPIEPPIIPPPIAPPPSLPPPSLPPPSTSVPPPSLPPPVSPSETLPPRLTSSPTSASASLPSTGAVVPPQQTTSTARPTQASASVATPPSASTPSSTSSNHTNTTASASSMAVIGGIVINDEGHEMDNNSQYPLMSSPPARAHAIHKPIPKGKKLPEYKVCMFGPQWAGKSRLVVRLLFDTFEEDNDPTVEDSYSTPYSVDGQECVLHIMDTSGDSSFYGMHPKWINWADGFICCYSSTSVETFDLVPKFRSEIVALKKAKTPPFTLVATHCDCTAEEKQVTTKEGISVAYRFKCPFYETSAAMGHYQDIDNCFQSIIREIRKAEKEPAKEDTKKPETTKKEAAPVTSAFGVPDIAATIQFAGKKRYAAIKAGHFYVFKNEQKFMANSSELSFSLVTSTVKPFPSKKNSLELWSIDKRYPLQFSSPEEVADWKKMFEAAIMSQLANVVSEKEASQAEAIAKDSSAAALTGPSPEECWAELKQVGRFNCICADCGAEDPDWASINLGVLFCIQCSGVHRSLGTHITKVRSLTLDKLELPVFLYMKAMGNALGNKVWEARMPQGVKPCSTDPRAAKDKFIRDKYANRAYTLQSNKSPEVLSQELYQAALTNDLQGSLFALSERADVFWKHPETQRTALHACSVSGSLPIAVMLLMSASLSKNEAELACARDVTGLTAADLATQSNKTDIKAYVEKQMAPVKQV